jgi:DNA-binding SARP family transcriptional activator
LRLILHGAAELRDDSDAIVSLTTKRTFLVLVVLAAHGGATVSRRALASAVWPAADERAARDSLRTALSGVRRAIPANALWSDADRLRLCPDAVRIASSAIDGEFMPDFDDDWVIERRLRDRGEAVEHFLAKARGCVEAGDLVAALELAERACARDPLSDEAAQLRILILQGQGKKSDAAKLSHDHRSRMLRELGAVSQVQPDVKAAKSPLMTTAEWLLERDPVEALAFLASTRPHWEVAPAAEGLEIHDRVLSAAGPTAKYRPTVEAQRLYIQWCFRGVDADLAYVAELRRRALSADEIVTAEQLTSVLAYSYLSSGRFAQALETVGELRELARKRDDARAIAAAEMTVGIVHQHAGDLNYSRRVMRNYAAAAEDSESLVDAAQKFLARSVLARMDGDFVVADEALQRAKAGFLANGALRMIGYTSLEEVELLSAAGDTLRAREILLEVVKLGSEVIGHSAVAMATDLLAKIGWQLGELDSAAENLVASDEYRSSIGTVASPYEQRRLAPIRRTVLERLGAKHVAELRARSAIRRARIDRLP